MIGIGRGQPRILSSIHNRVANGKCYALLDDACRGTNDTRHEIREPASGIGLDAMRIMPKHLRSIIVMDDVGAASSGRVTMAQGFIN